MNADLALILYKFFSFLYLKRDAQKAASANENKPHQKDEKDSDTSGDSSTSSTQPSN